MREVPWRRFFSSNSTIRAGRTEPDGAEASKICERAANVRVAGAARYGQGMLPGQELFHGVILRQSAGLESCTMLVSVLFLVQFSFTFTHI